MKILHVAKTAVGAGWVCQQVRVLRGLGFEITIALPSSTDGLAPKYKEYGATVVPLGVDVPARNPWRAPEILRACRRLVAEVHPDLLHMHHVGSALMLRTALGKSSPVPRIFQVPGPLHLEHDFFARLDISSAGPRDHWIAGCRWVEKKYRTLGVPQEHVAISYPGTETHGFTTVRSGLLRRELRLSADTPLVGMVCYMYAPKRFLGQVTGLKGHEDFIAALQIARREIPQLHGVIIGGAWNGAVRYENHLRSLGRRVCGDSLTFLGTRTDVPLLYPDLDLAVVPSHSENVGGAVEPLLSGVPVVATRVGGLPDLVEPGVTGTLVPPRDPQSLAAAIVDSMKHRSDAQRLASQGRKRAAWMFDIERTAREVAAIYEQVAERTPRMRAAS